MNDVSVGSGDKITVGERRTPPSSPVGGGAGWPEPATARGWGGAGEGPARRPSAPYPAHPALSQETRQMSTKVIPGTFPPEALNGRESVPAKGPSSFPSAISIVTPAN
ncbi:hypothetical protein GCM10022630_18190 [Thermobifida alba]